MSTVESSTAIVQHYSNNTATIRNKPIYFQFSNRQEIQAQQTVQTVHSNNNPNNSVESKQAASTNDQQAANSILIVTVLNTRVPVNLDHLHQIFKPYGDVLKIITFNKNGVFKALVQMGTVDSAANAKLLLEGKLEFKPVLS